MHYGSRAKKTFPSGYMKLESVFKLGATAASLKSRLGAMQTAPVPSTVITTSIPTTADRRLIYNLNRKTRIRIPNVSSAGNIATGAATITTTTQPHTPETHAMNAAHFLGKCSILVPNASSGAAIATVTPDRLSKDPANATEGLGMMSVVPCVRAFEKFAVGGSDFLFLDSFQFPSARADYAAPTCNSLLDSKMLTPPEVTFLQKMDMLLQQALNPEYPKAPTWFRCTSRLPSGKSNYSPHSILSVVSTMTVPEREEYYQAAQVVLCELLRVAEDPLNPIPTSLIRLHFLNVLRYYFAIGNKTDLNRLKAGYASILARISNRSSQEPKVTMDLMHMLHRAWSLRGTVEASAVADFIGLLLDVLFIAEFDAKLGEKIFPQVRSCWDLVMMHFDSDIMIDVIQDVLHPLSFEIGVVISTGFEASNVGKKLNGLGVRMQLLMEPTASVAPVIPVPQ